MKHLSDYYAQETCRCPECGTLIMVEYLHSRNGWIIGCAACRPTPKVDYKNGQKEVT